MAKNMKSKLFTLNYKDFAKGLALAVIAVVIGALQQALTAHGFDFASYDWSGIIKLSIEAGLSYLIKNYFSNEQGQVFGRIG